MAENEEDQESKTEDPSQKKLDDALKKGQVAISREVNHFILLLFISLIVAFVLPYIVNKFAIILKLYIEKSIDIRINASTINHLLSNALWKSIIHFSPIFLAIFIIALFSSYIQNGQFIFAIDQITPKLSRISIYSGIKRLFSLKSIIELLKGLFKILLIGLFLYLIIISDIQDLRFYSTFSTWGIIDKLQIMINNMLVCVCIIIAIIAGADLFYQRFEHFNNLKMTKHEQKEEYKQLEGDPIVKSKIKALRKQRAKNNIKQAVPNATVVITNPEHYAVCLYYNPNETDAPILVAKGLDLIAQKIKEIANENNIPIVENPPLARGIYKDVEIDDQIPIEYYETVAKIIGYVDSLNTRKKR